MSELAIVSVKPQEWEQPFEIPTAFRNGNLFPGLQKPFFVEEEDSLEVMPKSGREDMLLQIQQISFALTDITLFLDTHPGHPEAEKMKGQMQEKRKKLMRDFAVEYFPLTMDCVGDCEGETVPWEGGEHHVDL